MLDSKLKIAIVGAGVAGPALGLKLCRPGFECTILERTPRTIRPLCGEFLGPHGKELAESLGIPGLLEGFRPIHGMALYSPRGTEVLTRFPEGKSGVALNRQLF